MNGFTRSRIAAVWLGAQTVLVLLTASSLASATIITPGLSRVYVQSQMGTPLITVSDIETQVGTLSSLSANVAQSGSPSGGPATLHTSLNSWSAFDNVSKGTAYLNFTRTSTTLSTGMIWGGYARFRYEFHVDAPTTVTVDYDMLGSSTVDPNVTNPWNAMQGFRTSVNGTSYYVNWFTGTFSFPPHLPSPRPYAGTYVYAIPAGHSFLEIEVSAGSSAHSGQGTRLMEGTFEFQIGEAVVPEPSTGLLAGVGAVLALAAAGRRATRRLRV